MIGEYKFKKHRYKIEMEKWDNDITKAYYFGSNYCINNDQKEILLIKGPRRGWEMPGGQVEEGESLKDAAIREKKKNRE